MADLCVIADVQALTQITYSGSTKPTSTEVGAWITAITAQIEEMTGLKFTETTITSEKHDGNGTCYFMTDCYPITSITSLVVDGATLTADTDYWIESAGGGLIELLSPSTEVLEEYTGGRKSIVITYKYQTSNVPQSAKELCAVMVAMKAIGAMTMSASAQGSVESYSDGDVSLKYSTGDSVASSLINRYKELKRMLPARLVITGGAP